MWGHDYVSDRYKFWHIASIADVINRSNFGVNQLYGGAKFVVSHRSGSILSNITGCRCVDIRKYLQSDRYRRSTDEVENRLARVEVESADRI